MAASLPSESTIGIARPIGSMMAYCLLKHERYGGRSCECFEPI
jgi:hypothetical protein